MTTKWLDALLIAVPPDFVPNKELARPAPAGATVLGPLPADIVPLLMAQLYLRAAYLDRGHTQGVSLKESVWHDLQVKALGGLITASIHHHFEVVDRPVGAGLDSEGHFIAYALPFEFVTLVAFH